MRSHLLMILTAAVLPLSACNLYFSGGDDPDPCEFGGGTRGDRAAEEAPEEIRNPQTGMCESLWGGGGGWPCDDACGPCPAGAFQEPTDGEPAPIPTWGSCEGMCNGLEETTCLVTDSCRGIYTSEGFQECWQTDREVPLTTVPVECTGLEAQDCSRYDYCSAMHADSCAGTGTDPNGAEDSSFQCGVEQFISCFPEAKREEGCYGDSDCGEGFSCNASEVCLPPPSDNGDKCPIEICGVPQPCYGFCVPEQNPGECDGEVWCDALPPACPADSVPGISDGCFTDYCIPLSSCPQVPCEQTQSEAMCVQRAGCDALYEGVDCECTPEGCECSSWLFDSCETMGSVPPSP